MCKKSFADTYFGTAYEKYRRYLHQCLKSIDNTTGSNTNNAILTTQSSALGTVGVADSMRRFTLWGRLPPYLQS